jgi:glutathionylspermidine synthase
MFKINKEMMAYALSQRDVIEKDYKKTYEAIGQSKAVYKGKQLPFLYYPSIYSADDVVIFEKLTKEIYKIVNKSIEIYINHPEVRSIWDFDERLEELILIPHRFKSNVPMGRFDFFYYPDGQYKFCELNTDGTSAMNEETPLSDVLLETVVMKHFKEKYTIERYELYQSWVDEVTLIYKEFLSNGGQASEKPYVVIMDFMSKGSPHEFEEFKKVFVSSDYDCDIISPDELEFKEDRLYYNGKMIDIIYRRLVTRDMMDRYDDLQPLINGIKANQTCIIGSIKSQIVHTKKYFEALHHKRVRAYFSAEELAYIDKHIPYTSALIKDDNFSKYVKNKDDYIIKPVDLYASKGVYAGKEFDEKEWSNLLETSIAEGYIIQEFCGKSNNENLYFDESGHFKVKEVNNITGLFLYNEKLKGIFTRAGFNAVISDLNDGYSLSSVVVK